MSDEPTLQMGDSGDWVAHLQDLMRAAEFWQGYSDGSFSDDLEQAVQAMQDAFGLQQTGAVDDDTWSALQQRISALTSIGTDTSGDSASGPDTTSTGYDEDAWQAFLTANGPRWNGEDTAWQQFRDWFAYEAGQQGLADPANGFLAFVEGRQDRIAAFAAYGVTIESPANAGKGAGDQQSQDSAMDVSTYPEMKLGDSGDWVDYLDAMLTSNGF